MKTLSQAYKGSKHLTALTAMTKKNKEAARKTNGTRSHPRARSVARNAISMGNVTHNSVIMTKRGEGCSCVGGGRVSGVKSSVETCGSPVRE